MKKRTILIFCVSMLLSLIAGCGGGSRARLGCYATSTPGTRFIGLNDLGKHHSKGFGFGEGNGIVYTCRGGHIDITHLRLVADYTKEVCDKTYNCMIKNKNEFTFKLPVEPTVHHVKIGYPENWSSFSNAKKERIAKEFSLNLAPYVAFSASTWHEMLTLKGYSCMLFIPEDASGFSWEDGYSNLLGSLLAVKAMESTKYSYDEAMTILLNQKMNELGIQSAKVAKQASEKMSGSWFKGNFNVKMIKRNFDIGLDDGYVSPSLVPGLRICSDAEPILLPAPTLDFVEDYGFSIKYTIHPHEWEKGKLLKYLGGKKVVEPVKDFPILIKYLEQEALVKGWTIR